MLLGGLWHGAAWNYILWGAYHGTAAEHAPYHDARQGPAGPSGWPDRALLIDARFWSATAGCCSARIRSTRSRLTRTLLTGGGMPGRRPACRRCRLCSALVLLHVRESGVRFRQRPAATALAALRRLYVALFYFLLFGSSNAPHSSSTSSSERALAGLAGALSRAPAGRPPGVRPAIRGAGRAAASARGRRSEREAHAELQRPRIADRRDGVERRHRIRRDTHPGRTSCCA